MVTVHEVIQKEKECDAASRQILNIYHQLDERQQVFTYAMVERIMGHNYEKSASNKDYEKYIKAKEKSQ